MIYGTVGSGRLGDCWMGINKALYDSERQGKTILFSTWNPKKERSTKVLLEEILDLLDSSGEVELVDDPPSQGFSDVYRKKGWKFYPTKIDWKSGPWNRICYQYDGISGGHKKNPPEKDLAPLSNFIDGVEFLRLGKYMSLSENVKAMSESNCFVGIDSGFSHVSHSVGVPRFFIKYRYDFSGRHKGRKYTLCKGTHEAIYKVREFMKR